MRYFNLAHASMFYAGRINYVNSRRHVRILANRTNNNLTIALKAEIGNGVTTNTTRRRACPRGFRTVVQNVGKRTRRHHNTEFRYKRETNWYATRLNEND